MVLSFNHQILPPAQDHTKRTDVARPVFVPPTSIKKLCTVHGCLSDLIVNVLDGLALSGALGHFFFFLSET